MRTVRVSKTFAAALDDLLAYGEPIYGSSIVILKRAAVRAALLRAAQHPRLKQPHIALGLVVYPVTATPFVVLYDFDDTELRAHFIFHKNACLEDLDPRSAEW